MAASGAAVAALAGRRLGEEEDRRGGVRLGFGFGRAVWCGLGWGAVGRTQRIYGRAETRLVYGATLADWWVLTRFKSAHVLAAGKDLALRAVRSAVQFFLFLFLFC